MTAENLPGNPLELARAGSSEAENGLNGISLGILVSSADGAGAIGHLGLSRQAMSPVSRRISAGPQDFGEHANPFFGTDQPLRWSELLYFSAANVVIAVGALHSTTGGGASPRPGLSGRWSEPDPAVEYFDGQIRANPRFRHDDTEATEVLLSFGPDGGGLYTYGTSASLMAAVRAVSRSALEAQAPILFMQSPVALHRPLPTQRRADGSAERIREPFAPVLRASVGIDRRHPRRRLEFVRRLCGFAKELGLGLDVKDRRPGMARGDWFELNRIDDELIRTHQKELAGENEAVRVPRTRPVCIVGPARVGSTSACVEALDGVGAGLCAVSITTLHDISVIGMVVPVLDTRSAPPPDLRPDQSPAKARQAPIDDLGSLDTALTRLGRLASRTGRLTKPTPLRPLSSEAADYVLVAGRGRELPPGEGPEPERWALWASYEVSSVEVTAIDVLTVIQDAIDTAISSVVQIAPDAVRIDYGRSRLLDGARLRGRAKFSIPPIVEPPLKTQAEVLTEVCARAESACKESVVEGEIRISWRERWLGRLGELMP
jgi:hypothetical protein